MGGWVVQCVLLWWVDVWWLVVVFGGGGGGVRALHICVDVTTVEGQNDNQPGFLCFHPEFRQTITGTFPKTPEFWKNDHNDFPV